MPYVLLFSVFVIATCGLVYELIAGAQASYLLGDSVTQFSIIIGVYLFSMGLGSYASKFFHKNLLVVFIQAELLIGLVGGFSSSILFLCFEHVSSFQTVLYLLVGTTGMLVGLEIPLLMRILQSHFEFKDLVSKVFAFDYVGALVASVLFPLLLVPHLGLIRTSLFFGICNVVVGLGTLHLFRQEVGWVKSLQTLGIMVLIMLMFGMIYSDGILSYAESASYADDVVYSKTTSYQRMVLTKSKDDYRLFLNGNLQFSSRDEYRYHEGLVHVGLASLQHPKKVLVLGGGDGLAVREVLKYPSVDRVVLVDLDPAMTRLFSTHPTLTALNDHALTSPKVQVFNADAFLWLRKNNERFDFVVVDFPDPSNFSVGKLYTDSFYKLLKLALADHGLGVIQSTSPYVAKKSFWCVDETIKSVGLQTVPYHVYVPAFGDWGYIMVSHTQRALHLTLPKKLKFVDQALVDTFFVFPKDMRVEKQEVNKLNNQVLVRLFESEWEYYVN